MSWKYPEQPVKSGDVVEIDDINRTFTRFAEELDGGLNEHNWKKDTFIRQDCAEDVSMEVWSTSQAQNREIWPADYQQEWFRVRSGQDWSPVKSESHTASITATTKSGTLWVMGSLQHIQGSSNAAVVQYALRVDGAVIPESITGAGTTLSDATHAVFSVVNKFSYVIHGSGINQRARAVCLDTMVDVKPGTHTVELVARMISKTNSNDAYFWVGSRELIVISMRK
tara:strand:+ start:3619 stop:4296 length:678 start_codon:yes stop_codon:yes gene_type:complete